MSTTPFDFSTSAFRKAVVQIERRAERQLYEERLTACFVPTNALQDLRTTQNQLLYGRRGVGKTHTLKYLLAETVREGELAHYLDCTTFGTGGTAADTGVLFFSKLMRRLGESLLDDLVRTHALPAEQTASMESQLLRLEELSLPRDGAFDYAGINDAMNRYLDASGNSRLLLVIDEWAQVPRAAQPYFAEFLKRSLFANSRITLKIAIVDYLDQLATVVEGQPIGLERSGDIFSDIRMDHYFVWDKDNVQVEELFAQILYNHLALGLGLNLDASAEEKSDAVRSGFTQKKVFSELCRASEGNARDFLVLFGKAHEDFQRRHSANCISFQNVRQAAELWYRMDKTLAISSEAHLERFMDYLV